jgi:hypothetical protein
MNDAGLKKNSIQQRNSCLTGAENREMQASVFIFPAPYIP